VSGQSWAHLSVYGQWQDVQATRLYISRATTLEKNSIGVEIARTDGPVAQLRWFFAAVDRLRVPEDLPRILEIAEAYDVTFLV
jgi:hypothetical protein